MSFVTPFFGSLKEEATVFPCSAAGPLSRANKPHERNQKRVKEDPLYRHWVNIDRVLVLLLDGAHANFCFDFCEITASRSKRLLACLLYVVLDVSKLKKFFNTISITILFLVTASCQQTTSEKTVKLDELISSLILDVAQGDVLVRGHDRQGAEVSVELSCRVRVPEVVVSVESAVLAVQMIGGIGGASDCDGVFQIDLPRGADVSIRTDSGRIELSDVSGDVRLSTYHGDVHIQNTTGLLDVQVATGNVRGESLGGSHGQVYVGDGDVQLYYARVPSFIDIDIIRGNAALLVPESHYSISADTLEGEVDIKGLVDIPNSDRLLWLMVDTGNIRVASKQTSHLPGLPNPAAGAIDHWLGLPNDPN